MTDHQPQTLHAWEGILAPLNRPTTDGRMLADPQSAPRTRRLPLPLILQGAGGPGTIVAGLLTPTSVGTIEGVDIREAEVDGERMRVLWAHGTLDPTSPCYDQLVEQFAHGRAVGVDVDEVSVDDQTDTVIFTAWRLIGATLSGWPLEMTPLFKEARLWLR